MRKAEAVNSHGLMIDPGDLPAADPARNINPLLFESKVSTEIEPGGVGVVRRIA